MRSAIICRTHSARTTAKHLQSTCNISVFRSLSIDIHASQKNGRYNYPEVLSAILLYRAGVASLSGIAWVKGYLSTKFKPYNDGDRTKTVSYYSVCGKPLARTGQEETHRANYDAICPGGELDGDAQGQEPLNTELPPPLSRLLIRVLTYSSSAGLPSSQLRSHLYPWHLVADARVYKQDSFHISIGSCHQGLTARDQILVGDGHLST